MKATKMLRFGALALSAGLLVAFGAGCSSEVNPDYQVSTGGYHPFDNTDQHGAWLAENNYDFEKCTPCHGWDLKGEAVGTGGTVMRSCYDCHKNDDHKVDFQQASTEHPGYLRTHGYDLSTCYVCHRHTLTNPANGNTTTFGGSCSSSACHTAELDGPDACNTCHGNFAGDGSVQANWAPPADLGGNITTSDPGVGAHQAHLNVDTTMFAQVTCSDCHFVPSSWNTPGHFYGSLDQAQITFGSRASSRNFNPSYNFDQHTCSSVECHQDASPVWTQVDGTWNTCGSCHSLPPAPPHEQFNTQCSDCHGEVIDASGNIIAPQLHADGTVQVSFSQAH